MGDLFDIWPTVEFPEVESNKKKKKRNIFRNANFFMGVNNFTTYVVERKYY